MKFKSLFILALTNVLFILFAFPITVQGVYSSDVRKNVNVTVESTQVAVSISSERKENKFVLYVLKPIQTYEFLIHCSFKNIGYLNLLLCFIVLFSILIIYPLGVNAPPYMCNNY